MYRTATIIRLITLPSGTTVQRYEHHATTVSSQFSHFCPVNEDNKRQVLQAWTQGDKRGRVQGDRRTTSLRAMRIWVRNREPSPSPSAALPLLTFLRAASIFCPLYLCVPSAQNFRILLALLVVSLPSPSPSHSSLSLSLLSVARPFIHGLRFRLMRCEFIAKCNTRSASLSLFLSASLLLLLGLSAVKQRRHRRRTRSQSLLLMVLKSWP